MRLKSYFAGTVQEAIEKARVELGSEAMLLNSKRIAPEHRHLGAYEVVFGITDELLIHKPAAAPALASAETSVLKATEAVAAAKTVSRGKKRSMPFIAPSVDIETPKTVTPAAPKMSAAETKAKIAAPPVSEQNALAEELAELRKQIEGVKHSLSSAVQAESRPTKGKVSDQSDAHSQLSAFDFSPALTKELIAAAENREKSGRDTYAGPDQKTLNSFQRALLAELHDRVSVKPEVGKSGEARQVMMFVGPPGAGKTTTIAKMAVRLGLQKRMPVHLISLDTMRVGGSEQLGTYARILGVSFDAIYSIAALGQALEDHGSRKLIFIDSPGYAPAEMEEARQIARFLQNYPEIEVQLVLPAYLSSSALAKFSERFSLFNPEKLLFTHLDEVDTTGPLVEHAVRSALPISFLANGQSITSDLHDATKTRLTEGIFNTRAARTAA